MPKGELGLLNIPDGDLKSREPSSMAQNLLLDLAVLRKEAPFLAAHHRSLLRSRLPLSVLVEPRGEVSPALLHAKPVGAAEARKEGA